MTKFQNFKSVKSCYKLLSHCQIVLRSPLNQTNFSQKGNFWTEEFGLRVSVNQLLLNQLTLIQISIFFYHLIDL